MVSFTKSLRVDLLGRRDIYLIVVYITYNMGNRDLPDIYAHALRSAKYVYCSCRLIYEVYMEKICKFY